MRRGHVLVLASAILAGIYLSNQVTTESEGKATLVPKPKAVEAPVVAIATGKSNEYTKATIEAIRTAGGLEGIVKKGATVFVKPNIVVSSPSGAGVVTDYRVIQAVVWECKRLGAEKVVIGETPITCSWEEGFAVAGYNGIKGAEFIDLNVGKEQCYYLMPERSLVGAPFYVPKAFIDADVVIDVPILKTHSDAGVTLGLKCVGIGIPPLNIYYDDGGKRRLHSFGLNKTIPDINSIRKPDFVIIDGMVGGEGQGPVYPDPVESGLVIAGRDIVAVDTVGTTVMGFDPSEITYLVYASAVSQLGTMDMDSIKVAGKSIAQVQQAFSYPANEVGYPYKRTTVIRETVAAMSVDGSLDEWAAAWPNAMNSRKQFSPGWEKPSDISGNVMMMHDWANLYVAFSVTDDAVVAGRGYRDVTDPAGDGVELALSLNMPFETDMNGARSKRVAGKDFILLAGFGDDSGGVYDCVGNKAIDGAVVASRKTATGYSVEMKVPLASLPAAIKLRDEIWVDFGIADVDVSGKGAETRAVWSGQVYNQYAFPSAAGRAFVDAVKHPWVD